MSSVIAQRVMRRRPLGIFVRYLNLTSGPLVLDNSPSQPPLSVKTPVFCVWGSGTGVGKTVLSVGLAGAAQRAQEAFLYLKPVQTGAPIDDDAGTVARHVGGRMVLGPHARSVLGADGDQERPLSLHTSRTLFAWKLAASPHLAVKMEGRPVSDVDLVASLSREVNAESSFTLVETAGGVCSPGPSGTLQCDIMRPLRLPAILVGDGRLGGISATLAAHDSLLMRGYDTAVIVLFDGGLQNDSIISRHLANSSSMPTAPHVVVLPAFPVASGSSLRDWLSVNARSMDQVYSYLKEWHAARLAALQSMAVKAHTMLWWPFTQHQLVPPTQVKVIDSRCGESFSVYDRDTLTAQFDGSASWWTQGVPATHTHVITKAVAYASGRWGHVMFPENAHAAAMECASSLLRHVGGTWASRVFFSDNGSTAVEVALKMAFRKFLADREMCEQSAVPGGKLRVLALRGSYHGDTLGAMNAQAPSAYAGFLQNPWYRPHGLFLEPPTLALRQSKWHVTLPRDFCEEADVASFLLQFDNRSMAFAVKERLASPLAAAYRKQIESVVAGANAASGLDGPIAALLMEPVLHGASGMIMIDPLYQYVLGITCRELNIPVVLDEVFAGLWRLGSPSATQLLGDLQPDVACYAKLLTGGTVPLAATITSEAIFRAFYGTSKLSALLHGHSYTAHAIGCSAAVAALNMFSCPAENQNLALDGMSLIEMWDAAIVDRISCSPRVERVISLGTVLAVELKPVPGEVGGYASTAALGLAASLQACGVSTRPLGNVLYLMCGPMTPSVVRTSVLGKLVALIA